MVAPGGVCVVAPGGHAWLLWGRGVHGCLGACMVAPGGYVWLLPGACMLLQGACMVALGACMVAARGGMCGCSREMRGCCQVAMCGCLGGHAWVTMRYGDTINEWAVHILLECILVLTKMRMLKGVNIDDVVVHFCLKKEEILEITFPQKYFYLTE